MANGINYVLLGDKIKRQRNKRGVTQEKLSEMCEISTSFLGHIERGSRKLSLETLYKLSVVLEVSVDYLLLDTFDKNQGMFKNLEAAILGKPVEKVHAFMSAAAVLAENIDKL